MPRSVLALLSGLAVVLAFVRVRVNFQASPCFLGPSDKPCRNRSPPAPGSVRHFSANAVGRRGDLSSTTREGGR